MPSNCPNRPARSCWTGSNVRRRWIAFARNYRRQLACRSAKARRQRAHMACWPKLAGVEVSSEGELDVTRVINNLGDTPVRRAKAYEALDSFMSYALFSAKNVMPSDAAEALAKECRQMQAGLRQ